MKKYLDNSIYLCFGLFIVGLGLKFFRFPFHTAIMIIGAGGVLITAILNFIFKQRQAGIISLSTFLWIGLLIGLVKFLPTTYFLIAALISLLVVFMVYYKTKNFHKSHHMILANVLVITIIIGTMPSDKRYFLFNIQRNHHIEADYWAWDKYSWHLNKNGNKKEAVQALQKAHDIVINSNDIEMKKLISRHKTLLEKDEWRKFN